MIDAKRLSYAQRDQVMASAAKGDAVAVTKRQRVDGDYQQGNVVVTKEQRMENKFASMPADLALKARIKAKEDAKLDKIKLEIEDQVRLGEPGWKTRYYDDKLKAEDIEIGTENMPSLFPIHL